MRRYERSDVASEWVSLTTLELDIAIETGVRIWQKSQRDGRSDRNGWRGFAGQEGKRKQALGAVCERIAAKALGIYWPGVVDNFAAPDLPHNVEVKLIGREHYGLRVYPRNDDSRRVIGVVMPEGRERDLRYRVAGWYLAGDAKRPEWQMAPHGLPPMYAVPQSELWPVETLRRICAAELGSAYVQARLRTQCPRNGSPAGGTMPLSFAKVAR